MPPLQQFKSGDLLQLLTPVSSGEKPSQHSLEAPYTEAIVLGFDPSATSGMVNSVSKARRPTPNHWHILLHEPETGEWLPAAIRDTSGQLVPHIRREHALAEHRGKPVQYTTDELMRRVGAIAHRTSSISKAQND